jgi:hypothetical protein
METPFENQRKLDAIAKIWAKREQWQNLRETFTSVDALEALLFVGPITKFHLSRNIGLTSCAKPDLHLCRWCKKIVGSEDESLVPFVTSAVADRVTRKQGTVDFALWVWLSHCEGRESDCCDCGFALR